MKKLLSKYKKLLIIVSFAYIYLFVLLVAPSGFSLLTPGEITAIDKIYDIENIEFNNDINTVSVYSWNELTVFQKWMVKYSDRYDMFKQTDSRKDLSVAEINRQGKLSKEASHQQAIITAYKYANLKNSSITIDYDFKGLSVYSNFNKYAKIGALVTAIDDVSVNDVSTYDEFFKLTLDEIERDGETVYLRKQKYKITLDDGTTYNLDYKDDEFMSFMPKFEIKSTTPSYNEKADRRNVGGPSGGAMQTLAIYSALLGNDYGNLKIAGTGTIEAYNDSVGRIGGIIQKFYTIKESRVDIFIVPADQLDELNNIDFKDIKVYGVEKFEDIITIMEGYVVNA